MLLLIFEFLLRVSIYKSNNNVKTRALFVLVSESCDETKRKSQNNSNEEMEPNKKQ